MGHIPGDARQHGAPKDGAPEDKAAARARRIAGLVAWLPESWRRHVEWLRQPARFWLRLPVAVLLIAGGLLWFLPILGLWMLPLGVILLSEDIAPLRWATDRVLAWIERRHPHWLKGGAKKGAR